MVPIKIRLDNDDHYSGENKIEYIVMHDTGNYTDSDEGNANYFATGTRDASAHYFVDDDSITQIVKDEDGSFHCGDGGNKNGINNRNSISIEMCRVKGVVTPTTEKNAIDLVALKMKQYNIPLSKVVRHYDASGKNCPESFNLDKRWTRWNNFKRSLSIAIAPAPTRNEVHYRVRKSWADVAGQIGAYTDLGNAKVCADTHAGFNVYDINGIQIYPIAIAPTPAVEVIPETGVVTASVLNVRVRPDVSSPKIGQLVKGTKVKIASKRNGFYDIYFGNSGGYVSAEYIK